ncbi:glycosyltransferase [Aquabacterium fontiphilum]|uniref:glycosyltransferase n=1 Tax=Aquabacterium fontiphilum TaxID=450365 RepID=UPI0013788194|nr:glycosyltransferase [Aquabacterium fontiphilum]
MYVPTRNRRALLERAVRSVLDQDYPSFEVVVVDDASVDDTPELLATWSMREPRLRWFRQPQPQGAPAARNLALRAARGEFVTGLDDDDVFLPRRLMAFAEAWPHASRGRSRTFLYAQSRLLLPAGVSVSRRPAQVSMDDLCKGNCVGNQIFVPKELILAVGGFREGLPAWQDLDVWMSLLRAGAQGVRVNEITMEVDGRARADRITSQHRQLIEAARDAVLAHHTGLTRCQQRDLFLQALGRHYGFPLRWQDVQAVWKLDPSRHTVRRLLSVAWRMLRGR